MNALLRRVAHLDMDAFYASVELLRYPELRGLPVVIGGRDDHKPIICTDGRKHFYRLCEYVGRGVVTTATYEARAAGVFSAMGLMKSAQLVPNAILLPVDFDIYRRYSGLFKAAVSGIASHIEDSGIDEIYIDLTDSPESSLIMAKRLKHAVRDTTQLSCSIGIAPNKLLAKICSDLEKPDGITILEESDIPNRIWPLSVRRINGIGPKATKKLASLGITTIAELAQADMSFLRIHFGKNYSAWLYEASRGIDQRVVITNTEPRSLSRETTFEQDLHPHQDRSILSEAFTSLCLCIAKDLKRKGYVGRTIGIKLRFEDFHTITRDCTLTTYTADPRIIRRAAGECLRRMPLKKKLRLLGVKISTLSSIRNSTLISPQKELPFLY